LSRKRALICVFEVVLLDTGRSLVLADRQKKSA
jgi:hypothetical protein